MSVIAHGSIRRSSEISGFGIVTLFSLAGLALSALLVRLGVDLGAAFAMG